MIDSKPVFCMMSMSMHTQDNMEKCGITEDMVEYHACDRCGVKCWGEKGELAMFKDKLADGAYGKHRDSHCYCSDCAVSEMQRMGGEGAKYKVRFCDNPEDEDPELARRGEELRLALEAGYFDRVMLPNGERAFEV